MPENTDTYLSVKRPGSGIYKEKGSKFLAYAFPILHPDEIKRHLDELRKKHHDARHHGYAWKIGKGEGTYRTNDDGEPSGTAGKPIFGRIQSHGLTQILIVVVRYFGGTKLGTSGLIRAYRSAAEEAILSGGVIAKIFENHIKFTFTYEALNEIMNYVKSAPFAIINQQFEDQGSIEIAVPESEAESVLLTLKSIKGVRMASAKNEPSK